MIAAYKVHKCFIILYRFSNFLVKFSIQYLIISSVLSLQNKMPYGLKNWKEWLEYSMSLGELWEIILERKTGLII